MIDTNELANTARVRKDSLERKKILVQLSKHENVEFESRIFAPEFKFNTKEPLRYYLWMMELHKWLRENKYEQLKKGFMTSHFMDNINVDLLEYNLTETLKILTNDTTEK